jgi:hemolysin III
LEPQNNIHMAGAADPVAAGTHLLAFLGMLGGWKALARRTVARPYERALVLVYSFSILVQYAASTVYHVSEHDPLLRRVDHATIYVLIAGTFTPLTGLMVGGTLRMAVLAAIWAFTIFGVVLKLFFFGWIARHETVDIALYLGAGWFGTVPTFVIWRSGERRTTAWILTGAILYTIGALCELNGWPMIVPQVFNFHEVFHLCVMAAGAAIFVAIWRSVDARIAASLTDRVVLTRRSG